MDFNRHIWLCLLLCCSKPLTAKPKTPLPKNPEPIVVMAYNVENLFDATHDEGKDDWPYLPLNQKDTAEVKKGCKDSAGDNKFRMKECTETDWSEAALKVKLERIGKIIGSKCPDLLFLEEIENIKILERLRTEFLKDCHYKSSVLLEGEDRRGIDAGMLSRFERKGEPQLHGIDFVETRKIGDDPHTRGILQAEFVLPNGDTLTALGVHFPAPYHPFVNRQDAMESLTRVARKAAETSQIVVAAGDFNTNSREDSQLYRGIAAKDWFISHLEGCKTCLGSHYYKKDKLWSFLDSIMLFKGAKKNPKHSWILNGDSVELVKGFDFQTDAEGLPISWENEQVPGQSDHLPLLLRLEAIPTKK